jgi:N-acetylneuraminic acid mutarotase
MVSRRLPSLRLIAIACIAMALLISKAIAQVPNSWSDAGSMGFAHNGHTATLLLDGRVLVVGGGPAASLNQAEVYDGSGWSSAGSLAQGRSGHTATRLADGRVLVTGGFGTTDYLASAEIFDPSSGDWSSTADMSETRFGHSAALLPDGRVLVAGGNDRISAGPQFHLRVGQATAEIFDPATGSWSPANSMATGRWFHTATALPDGRVLVAGGFGGYHHGTGFWSTALAEIYNPATDEWTATGSMNDALHGMFNHSALLLPDGRVLAVADGSGTPTRAELYDPASGTWTLTGNMITRRIGTGLFPAALLPDGRVLVTGGFVSAPQPTANASTALAELYDPATNAWSAVASMATARAGHTATALPDGRVLVAGGQNRRNVGATTQTTLLSSAEVYTADFVPPPSISIDNVTLVEGNAGTGNAVFTVTLSTSSSLPVTVDYATSDGTATVGEDYAAAAGTVTFDPGEISRTITIQIHRDIVVEPSETFFVTLTNAVNATIGDTQGLGTITNDDVPLPTVSINDVAVAEGPSLMSMSRSSHTATRLADGRVLVAGAGSAELFDPASGSWSGAGSIANRFVHTATVLQDGRVLIAGGWNFASPFASAEVFNPATATWSATGSLNQARWDHTATLLADGRVLVTGGSMRVGSVTTSLSSAEVYDPAAGTWTPTGGLGTARANHTATLLTDGRVLVTGGGDDIASAEIYNPSTGNWSGAGNMAQARFGHASVRLPDGRVLVAGGANTNVLAAAELYDPAANAWAPTGNMTAVRYWFSNAWVLPDGTVLVAGSFSGGGQASAELYNPATGTWSATDSMQVGRGAHRTTLLADGRVLATGGRNSTGALNSAEVYDPATAAWSGASGMDAVFTLSLSSASAQNILVEFTTVALTAIEAEETDETTGDYSGRQGSLVFFAGETTKTLRVRLTGDYVLEPDETFAVMLTSATNATLADAEGIGTILNDDAAPTLSIGNATVVEGNTSSTGATFTVTLSWPSADTVTVDFATGNSSAQAGSDFTPAAGTLTFTPGETAQTIAIDVHGDLEIEPDEIFFVTLSNATTVAIADGQGTGTITNDDVPSISIDDVAVVEGNAGTSLAVFTVALSAPNLGSVTVDFHTVDVPGMATSGVDYAPGAGTVTFSPGETARPIPIVVHGDLSLEVDETFAVVLVNAVNATIGDGQGIGTILNDEVPPSLSINDVTVTEGDSGRMALARNTNTATLLTDGRVLVAGHSPAEVYNPATNRWTTTGTLVHPRYVHTATRIMGGRVLVAGGWNDVVAFGEAEVYDPSTNSWSAAASMVEARWAHTATLLQGARVLVAGGQRLISGGTQTLASTEVYHASSDTWSTSGSMATPRREHTATRLSDGRVLVTGGRNGGTTLASAEVYDPVSETWSPTGNMAAARSGHVVALLPDGRVLVAGGYNNAGHLSSAELYNPVTGTWTTTGSMTAPRYWIGQSASLLPDGRVLVAGSSRNGGLASADLYDPSTGTWSATGTMAEGRGVYASAPLMDGRVLVAGGRNAVSGRLRTAELYDPTTGTWDPAGGAIVVFTVTLSPASDQTVTVHLATADGTATAAGADYNGGTATVVFNPGVVSRGVSVRVNPDRDVEPDETFAANLTNASNAIIADGTGIGTIVNDDEPPVSLSIDTPAGSDVVVDLPPLTLTFDSVTQAGQSHLTTSTTGPSSPSGFALGDPPTYIDLSTSAGFTGSVEICIDYSSFSYTNETLLRLFHFDDPAWIDVTTSLDTVANVICGNTTSFSPFAIFEPIESSGHLLSLPANIMAEATSAAGAIVDFTATASQEMDGPLSVDCVPSAGSMFSLGSTSVSCSAVDGTGSSTSGSFTVTVVDSTAPVLTLPADITRSTTNPAGTVVDFSASATDLVDGAVGIQCSPVSGSLFPIGVTTVLCTAVDSRENTAEGSFTVSVVLNTPDPTNRPPRLRGLKDRRVSATSPAGAVVKFRVWGRDAEDGRLPADCSHQSGDVFPIGVTIVSCTTTDSDSATATGSFTVKVMPNKPPKLWGLDDIKVTTASPAGARVKFRVWGVDSEDGLLPAVCSHQSSVIFPIGQTVVSCRTTDSAGATATGSFTVKVHRRFFGHQ